MIIISSSSPEEDANTTTLHIPIVSNVHKPELGFDTVIALVPPEQVAPRPASPGMDPRIQVLASRLAIGQARDMGEGLRESHWWITRDPAVVAERGLMHDCPTCRAGVDQALAHMNEHPEAVVAVGLLSWCDQ